MATMISEVYDAFKSAGAPAEKVRKAAEALADYDHRFDGVDRELLRVQSEVTLLKWMVGANVALTVAILARLLTI